MHKKIPTIKENSLEKPPILYHGSINKNIEILKPSKREFMRKQGNFLFASPNKKAALAYLAGGDYPWKSGSYGDDKIIRSILPITREEFIKNDKGGALYILDSNKFRSEPGRAEYEWATEEEVSPIEKEVFDSALHTMEQAGIKIYFLGSLEKYENFRKLSSSKERIDFLESLESK